MGDVVRINTPNVGIKTKAATVHADEAQVLTRNNITKVINDGEYINDGQKAELLALADELAEYERLANRHGYLKKEDGTEETKKHNAAIVKKSISSCRGRIKTQAKSAGVKGATSNDTVPACDFTYIKGKFKEWIRAARSGDGAEKHDKYRNTLISAIHARCKNLRVSNEKRKSYMMAEYGVDSLKIISNEDLKRFHSYVFNGRPTFKSHKQDTLINEKRLRDLEDLIAHKQHHDPSFDIQNTGMYKFQFFAELHERYPHDFDIKADAFEGFWSSAGVKKLKIRVKGGRPSKEMSEKYDRYILKAKKT